MSTPDTIARTEFKAYKKARAFLADRYELEYKELGRRLKTVKRYEQTFNVYLKEDPHTTIPMFKLAPFMSGKETYQYFFDRGFTKELMKEFSIGRDLDNKTITIPVFNVDNTLAGVIGRYISAKRKKNQRYKIYFDFERGSVLYPMNKAQPLNDTIIIVEGQFDAIRMYDLGYTNTFALMTNQMSKRQADIVCSICSTVIWIGDNDDRGIEGREKAYKMLKNKITFKVVDYPDYGKDVCDWSSDDIKCMLENAHSLFVRKVKRLN